MADFDQHPQGERFEVRHACPQCPVGVAGPGQLLLPANPLCPTCHGSRLVSTADLAAYQARVLHGVAL